MTKSEIINNVCKNTKENRSVCEFIIDSFMDEIADSLIKGEKVNIKGFMKFEIGERPQREGRNPQTGEVVTFPPVKTVKCKVCQAIKDAINGK